MRLEAMPQGRGSSRASPAAAQALENVGRGLASGLRRGLSRTREAKRSSSFRGIWVSSERNRKSIGFELGFRFRFLFSFRLGN